MSVVIVPYRGGDPVREANWHRARAQWESRGFTVVVGDPGGEWRTARARNIAARKAGGWETAVFADADILLEKPEQALGALELAASTGGYVVCYETLCYLNEKRVVYHRAKGPWICAFAIRRDLWELLGGFDERFPGNDNEDISFLTAARTLGPGMGRVGGLAFHQWHEPRTDRLVGGELAQRYKDANGDPDLMRELVAR